MSVPLQSVPDNQRENTDSAEPVSVPEAHQQAAEIIATARREAEAIVAAASNNASAGVPNPLAALGDNAEEIIGQVRKLIRKQRQIQAEREEMVAEIAALKEERDELVSRLTDAVERMEELAALADQAQTRAPLPNPPPRPATPPPPPIATAPPAPPAAPSRPEPISAPPVQADDEDTSLAARLRQAEQEEQKQHDDKDDSSLAARLERAEREREAQARTDGQPGSNGGSNSAAGNGGNGAGPATVGSDGRSFYDRHSAKLPRLEGDGGRSVLSAIGDMRPESEPKGRKGRRRTKR